MYTAAVTFQVLSAAFCTTLLLLAASNMSNILQAEEGNESTRIFGELDQVEHHSITYGRRIEEEINLGSSAERGDDQKELAARLRSVILQQASTNENKMAHRLSSRKLIMGSLSRHHDDSITSSSSFSSSSSEKSVMIRKSKQRRQLVEGEALIKADQNEAKSAATATESGAQSLNTDRETHKNAVDDSTSFHVDYNGPRTHPPRNN